jgi:putative membrane protein
MSEETPNPADPRANLAHGRTSLATYQTGLALDRTTLAWINTTLAMASFGFGMVAFFRTLEEQSPSAKTLRLHQGATWMGTALIVLGIVSTIFAGLSHWSTLRKLRRGETPVLSVWSLSLTVAILLVVISLAALWALFRR